jgi:hypothetical protein
MIGPLEKAPVHHDSEIDEGSMYTMKADTYYP